MVSSPACCMRAVHPNRLHIRDRVLCLPEWWRRYFVLPVILIHVVLAKSTMQGNLLYMTTLWPTCCKTHYSMPKKVFPTLRYDSPSAIWIEDPKIPV